LGGVAVVVAAHGAAPTLADAVTSALDQPEVAQVVVVDDASPDGTSDVARGLAERDARVELVRRQVRGGPSAARDDGLARVRAATVCFLDADDRLLDGAVAALRGALEADAGAVAALGRFHAVGDDGEGAAVGRWGDDQLRPVVRRGGSLVDSDEGLTPEALVTRLVSPPPGAWLVDVATLRAVGGFDASVPRSEDLELLVRLAAAGRVVLVDRDVLAYRRHDRQRSAAGARRRWGRGRALWSMLRAAPSTVATRRLAHGMCAYHLELFSQRARVRSLRVRAMGVRNLLTAAVLAVAWPLAAALPRRLPSPLAPAVD
jgi:glycosyltransferase involved in cell wall biosynthesis